MSVLCVHASVCEVVCMCVHVYASVWVHIFVCVWKKNKPWLMHDSNISLVQNFSNKIIWLTDVPQQQFRFKYYAQIWTQWHFFSRMSEKTTDEWLAQLEGSGIPYGPINSMKSVFSDAQVLLCLQHFSLDFTIAKFSFNCIYFIILLSN